MTRNEILIAGVLAVAISACDSAGTPRAVDSAKATAASPDMQRRLATYTTVKLEADISALTPKERQMIPLLIDASRVMDSIYWIQSSGSRDSLLAQVEDAGVRRYIDVNYGPYDRLDNNSAFVPGIGPRPPGANLYPHDITKEEFEAEVAKGPAARADSLKSLYTLVRRRPDRTLYAVPYHTEFRKHNEVAAGSSVKPPRLPKIRDSGAISSFARPRSSTITTSQVISHGWT